MPHPHLDRHRASLYLTRCLTICPTICLTLCLALLLAPCTAAGQAAPAARDTTPTAVLRAYIAAYNAHDIDAVVALLDPDFVWLSVVGDSVQIEARGPAAVREQLVSYFRSLPSARSEIEDVSALGPWVSVKERAHWTNARGPRSQASLSVYEVRGGRLRRVWYYPVVRGD